jgi:hypothetical protein
MYLTLPGEEGYDVIALIEAGLLATNESGGISDADARLVVGYERHLPTLSSLKDKIPGLAVRPTSVGDALGGSAPEAAPTSKTAKRDFRATVVNLDMNQTIKPDGTGTFEIPRLVAKIGNLHLATPNRPLVSPWVLCVTLHGEFNGDVDFKEGQMACISDACSSSPFSGLVKQHAPWIHENYVVSTETDRTRIQIATLLVTCVQIVECLCAQGWKPKFRYAAYYQHDSPGSAPMVTLVAELTIGDPARFFDARKVAYQSLASAWCCIEAGGTVVY